VSGPGQAPWLGSPPAGTAPDAGSPSSPPGLAPTILVTFFLNLFGLIPASRGARRARRLGRPAERYWIAFAASFVGSVLLYALITVLTLLLAARDDGSVASADAGSDAPAPVHLKAERIPPGDIVKLCELMPTSALASWNVPEHWEDPVNHGQRPTGPLQDSFGGYACQIHTGGVILQLEAVDLTQPDITTWPPHPQGSGGSTEQLRGVADEAWVITDPGFNAPVQVAATSGDVGVVMLALGVRGWQPPDMDATVREFTEQVKAAISTLQALED
jgi:hypothetical protein